MKCLIIDANSLLYRAYYATQKLAITQMYGQTTNGVFTALKMLKKFLNSQNVAYQTVLATFDLGKATLRHQAYQAYKAKRIKTPEALIEQIPLFKTFLLTLKIQLFEDAKYEADDFVASLTKAIIAKYGTCEIDILTSDYDLLQLVKPQVRVLLFKTGISKLQVVNDANFFTNFCLQPQQIPDYKALVGDQSDNLPGIKGIGPKTAQTLLQKYQNLEQIYQNSAQLPLVIRNKIQDAEQQKQAFQIKQLTLLNTTIPLQIVWNQLPVDFDAPEMQKLYHQYHMKSFFKKTNQKAFKF